MLSVKNNFPQGVISYVIIDILDQKENKKEQCGAFSLVALGLR